MPAACRIIQLVSSSRRSRLEWCAATVWLGFLQELLKSRSMPLGFAPPTQGGGDESSGGGVS